MDFIRLAEMIRRFDNTDLLVNEIELLEGRQDIKTVDDLTDYLEEELQYFEY